ncbi:probable E3 ubiquitin-protein ligase hip1 [Phtheirospermum japonicum]|uniref:RING-type E3 ubiquitin transferase n=1 Tax=Phtheirospermum japonicum TaxID=374723 RepID=A0A830B3S8_9LAMI|nr:probable E3 ubiquitin-protein ligase hip1 [Phtheirospermum japonicum]
MGHRNIQFNNHMIDFQADQAHNHLHPEPCIVYTNVPNYPQQFHPIPERHDNALFYGMHQYNGVGPQRNLDLNVAPPPSSHFNPYLSPPAGITDFPIHGGVHNNISPFKRKNAEGTSSSYPYQNTPAGPGSSSVVGPSADVARGDPTACNFMGPEPMVESGSLRSVRNRAVGMVGSDSVLEQHNNNTNNSNVIQGNYVAPPPVQLPGNPWLDMNFGSSNGGDMGALAWGQPPNLPYMHPNVNGACVEAGNIGVQGYHQVAAINRGAGFLHPQARSNPPHPAPPIRGYNVNHLSQMANTSSRGIPMIRYSNTSIDPFQDGVDAGPAFVAPIPPTGFQVYRPHRGEIVLDRNARHRSFAHMRVLPEDEVAMLEIPGYHVAAGESVDQHRDMRLDIDHMSYEELLALGEQIGSVGTGLSKEFIKNNLKTRTFTPVPACINLEVVPSAEQETVNFCVVCQTDYGHEESIGVLDCGHEYHRECIKQWLVMKNSCPVCKSTALRGKGKDLAIDGR